MIWKIITNNVKSVEVPTLLETSSNYLLMFNIMTKIEKIIEF